MSGRVSISLGAMLAAIVCGHSSTSAAQDVDRGSAGVTLPCATAAGAGDDGGPGPGGDDIVLGPLELVSIKRFARYPRRHFEPRRGNDFSAKAPLTIGSGARVRLAVAPRWRRHASLFYAESTRGARRVEGGHAVLDFEACTDAERTFWSGGLKVDGARCVPLRVTVDDGETRTLRVAFGKGMCKSRKLAAG